MQLVLVSGAYLLYSNRINKRTLIFLGGLLLTLKLSRLFDQRLML